MCVPHRPVAAFDATPAGTCGQVCRVPSALATDGVSAGLDCDGGGFVVIDSLPVTACIGLDFGEVRSLDPVVIRMASSPSACGTSCSGNGNCGSGHSAIVFYGQEKGVYELAEEIPVEPTLKDYRFSFRLAARYVIVCRNGSGPFRDDLVVDSVTSFGPCP